MGGVSGDPTVSSPMGELATRWRSEAEFLRAHGALEAAITKERDASELESTWQAWYVEELTISQAATESGYSPDRLRELVREGRIPGLRSADSRGEIHLRRCDLPRRPAGGSVEPVEALADRVLAGRR